MNIMNRINHVMSMFNILFERDGHYYIHNTLRGGLHEINAAAFNLCSLAQKDAQLVANIPADLEVKLLSAGYLVPKDTDEDAIRLLRYARLQKSFQNDRLSLVIAPTLYCNFACPYCYENQLPYQKMQENVIEDLLTFIGQRAKRHKFLEICWHGGEPLTATATIKDILSRIEKEIELPIKGHSIVTNGFLINDDFFSCFEEFPLGFIQITIDGNEETHNNNRISKSGEPTYKQIITNVDKLVERMPNANIGIRMNIHKSNVQGFIPLYTTLSQRWIGSRVNIYPAFVQDHQSCRVPCFNSIEKTELLHKLHKQLGRKYGDSDMQIKTGGCTAIYESSYVIDPRGNLFKCWVDVGNPAMRIGDLKNGVYNYSLVEKYMLSSDKFSDSKCLKCSVLPICSGGCNKYRLDTSYSQTDICPLAPDAIPQFFDVHQLNESK